MGVAQLAEHRVVVPGVAGSSPVAHPTKHDEGQREGALPFFVSYDCRLVDSYR